MIAYPRFCQLQQLHDSQGLNVSPSAKEVILDRRTGAYGLPQAHVRPRTSRPHTSQRDPFKPEIVRLLDRHPSSAAQVVQRLREQGVAGSYGLVKTSRRTVRPKRQPACLTLAFAPGECAQGDWGSFGSVPVGQTCRRLSCFVLVLC